MSWTKATRKNPQEWSTPLINALFNNRAKQIRNDCQLSFLNSRLVTVIFSDTSSLSDKRRFSVFTMLKRMLESCAPKTWRFLRDNVTTLPWCNFNASGCNVKKRYLYTCCTLVPTKKAKSPWKIKLWLARIEHLQTQCTSSFFGGGGGVSKFLDKQI